MKQHLLICSLWLFCLTPLSAQQLRFQDLPIRVAYFGESGIHPGLKLGIEYPLLENSKSKGRLFKGRQEKLGDKRKTRQLFLAGNLGTYVHTNNHLGLFAGAEVGVRRIKAKNGNFVELNLGLGYLQRMYLVDTYVLGADKSLDQIGTAGRGGLMLSIAPAFGRDLSVQKGKPLQWYVKPGLQFSRYNHSFLPNGFLEVGVQFN